jgi:FkbM family methyltransferase
MSSKKLINLYRSIFGSKYLYGFNELLFRCSLRGLGIKNTQNFSVSGEQHFLKKNAVKIDIVFDVGANSGLYSIKVKSFNGDCKVFAFEPHPNSFLQLQKNGKRLSFKSFNFGFGKTEGKFILYDYSGSPGSMHASLHQEVIENLHQEDSEGNEVEIRTIDQFVEENNINFIDLLKIDTEGTEYDVLLGAGKLLKENRIRAIQFEFNKMNVYSRIFFRDFYVLLKNYRFYRMLKDGLVPIKKYKPITCELFAFQNIIAINNEYSTKYCP